jgi:hypothetical protein
MYRSHDPGAWAELVRAFLRGCAVWAARSDPRVRTAVVEPPEPVLVGYSAPYVCACLTGSGRPISARLRVNGLPNGTQRQFTVQLRDWTDTVTPLPADCRVFLLDPETVTQLLATTNRTDIKEVFAPEVLAGNVELARVLSLAPVLDGVIGPDGKLTLPPLLLSDDFPDVQKLPPGAAVVLVVNDVGDGGA